MLHLYSFSIYLAFAASCILCLTDLDKTRNFYPGGKKMENSLTKLAAVKLHYSPDLYKIVDLLNKTLKEQDFMFGLALDGTNEEQAIFTIYQS
jgi:hypothetical protein